MFKSTDELKWWLIETAWDKPYWELVEKRAKELLSDGCTGVPDWYIWTCWEHDIHNRTHKFLCGCELTFKQAAYIIRVRIQQASIFKVFSPLSWLRWVGVLILARGAWKSYGK